MAILGLDPPFLGPALGVIAVVLAKFVDIYYDWFPDNVANWEALIVRAGINIVLTVITFMLTGALNIVFGSSPRGLFSFIICFMSIMAIVVVGRGVMAIMVLMTLFDANALANAFNWQQDVPVQTVVPLPRNGNSGEAS